MSTSSAPSLSTTSEKSPRLSTSTTSSTSTYLAKPAPSDPSSAEKPSKTSSLRKKLHLSSKSKKNDSMKAPASLADRNAAIEKKEMHFMALALHASCK